MKTYNYGCLQRCYLVCLQTSVFTYYNAALKQSVNTTDNYYIHNNNVSYLLSVCIMSYDVMSQDLYLIAQAPRMEQ